MNRRAWLKTLGCSLVLTTGFSSVWATAQPQMGSSLFHVFGALPEPIEIKRVLAANKAAAVMLNSVAPAQLLGWPTALNPAVLPWLSASSAKLPVVGALDGVDATLTPEQLLELNPDVIVSVGPNTPQQQAQAQRISDATGIAYVLIDGQIQDAPEQLLWLGTLLGQQRHGQQLAHTAQQVLDQAKTVDGPLPTVYWAQADNGLKTITAQSPIHSVLSAVGAQNVAQNLSSPQTTLEQIQQWNPDFILTPDPAFYQHVFEELDWIKLPAVRNQRVLFVPEQPFSWLGEPASVNRLLGVYWLAAQLQNKPEAERLKELRHLFIMLYQTAPSLEQLQQLLSTPMQFAY